MITVSLQDMRPDPQDTVVFYLENIYLLLANPPNASQTSSASFTLASPPTFSPPPWAIWVNSLWFLSGVSSILGAGSAMFLQGWTKRYIWITRHPHLTPDRRARVRELFSKYTRGPYIFWGTGPMVFLVHFSIFLFMAGGIIYIHYVNRIFFNILGSWIAVLLIILYVTYASTSILKTEVLFYAPLSPLIFRICLRVSHAVLEISSHLPYLGRLCDYYRLRCRDLHLRYRGGMLEGKRKAAEVAASTRSSEIDINILEWTVDFLVEDAALEKFLGAIPGFFDSKLVTDVRERLSEDFRIKFGRALDGFLDHTFSSDAFSGSVRSDRLLTCLSAARAALGPGDVSRILDDVYDGRWPMALRSIEVGYAVRRWDDDVRFSSLSRRIVGRIISRVRERDDRWIALVKDEFGIPELAFEDHVGGGGDDASLIVLIHVARRLMQVRTDSLPPWDPDVLRGLSRFDVRNTLPGLRYNFCALWNELVQEARRHGGAGSIPVLILREICHLHTVLHQGADVAPATYSGLTASDGNALLEPSLFPSCYIVDHCLDLAIQVSPDEGVLPPAFHVSVTPPFPTPVHSSPLPVPLEGQSVARSSDFTHAEISAISHIVATSPSSINAIRLARRQVQEMEVTPSSTIGFSSPSAPTSIPSHSSRATNPLLPASTNSAVTRTEDHFAPTQETPSPPSSSPAATRRFVSPQISRILEGPAAPNLGNTAVHDDTLNLDPHISTEAYSRRGKSAASSNQDVATSSRRESREGGPR